MSKVYYSQADSRWANYPYPSSAHPKATIKTSGCGPTSAAMIVSSLKATKTPKDMARLFLDNGQRGTEGTKNSAFSWTANKFGLDMIETTNIDKGIEVLRKDGMCVAICSAGGVFSTGGHYIVLAYMRDNNTICVFDPYLYKNKFNTPSRKGKVTVNGNDVYITINNFKKYARCARLFCYSKQTVVPKIDSSHMKDVQRWLIDEYNSEVKATGKADAQTKIALVKAWKKQCNEKWGADFATDSNGNIISGEFGLKSKEFAKKVIRHQGESGKMIKFIQALCYYHGYNKNSFSGNYGSGTVEDVLNFKKAKGLSNDGTVVGQNFWYEAMK